MDTFHIHRKRKKEKWKLRRQHHPSIFIFNLLNYNLLPLRQTIRSFVLCLFPFTGVLCACARSACVYFLFSFFFSLGETKEQHCRIQPLRGFICIPFTCVSLSIQRVHLLLWTASFSCSNTPSIVFSVYACTRVQRSHHAIKRKDKVANERRKERCDWIQKKCAGTYPSNRARHRVATRYTESQLDN